MIYPKPESEAEMKKLHKESYELEKADLIATFNEQGYEQKYLNDFLINSLKNEFEEELKEDGLIV